MEPCFNTWRAYGSPVCRFGSGLLRDLRVVDHVVGWSRRNAMSLFYFVGGVLALGILVYLLIALLKPEVFS
jgi:K+-transporting ATPase KdpF subunit